MNRRRGDRLSRLDWGRRPRRRALMQGYGSRLGGRSAYHGSYGRGGYGGFGQGSYGTRGYGGYGGPGGIGGEERNETRFAGFAGYGTEIRDGYGGPDGSDEFPPDYGASRYGQAYPDYAGGQPEARHRGRGPRNYTPSDERIREDINALLTDDPHLDAADIDVAVRGGEVTLGGHVMSRQDRHRAEDLAESIAGVRHVRNDLRIREIARPGA